MQSIQSCIFPVTEFQIISADLAHLDDIEGLDCADLDFRMATPTEQDRQGILDAHYIEAVAGKQVAPLNQFMDSKK